VSAFSSAFSSAFDNPSENVILPVLLASPRIINVNELTKISFSLILSRLGQPALGITPTINISKNGSTFELVNRTISEIGLGWYSIQLDAYDVDTLGDLIIHISAASCVSTIIQIKISNSILGQNDLVSIRSELTPELTKIMLLENGLTSTQATVLQEIYSLYGLDFTKPLIVTNTSRTAGLGIQQNIDTNSTRTIITRM
jgi:hypothetical protein